MSQKTIAVGTPSAMVNVDNNFQNIQDNFTELYAGKQDIPPSNHIGEAGRQGFGVGICPSLPAGMSMMPGSTDPASENYGNYQYSDGSVMCWIPAFYYKYGDGTNGLLVNDCKIKSYSAYASVAAANADGYALHRAFYDGDTIQLGVFVDKYKCSNNSGVASSIKNGAPLSSSPLHNPFSGLTGAPSNTYSGALVAAKTRGNNFFCSSIFIYGMLALLSYAHGKAAQSNAWCAWYDSAGTTNFPKGNNNNALGDANDSTVSYTTDNYSNCGLAGSGVPFAKTTHNGQSCGVADVNGNIYEISPGFTCVESPKSISAIGKGNPCAVTIAAHGATTGNLVRIYNIVGMTELNDKIFSITVVDANTVTLNGVDSSTFAAYVSGGTVGIGTFYALSVIKSIKNITAGKSLATDHWGAAGLSANFTIVTPKFATTYPNNGYAQRFGSGASKVLSAALSGDGWLLTGMGFPDSGGISVAGSNAFGADYFYQYILSDMCPAVGGNWSNVGSAGVWVLHLGVARGGSGDGVGFRAALYL